MQALILDPIFSQGWGRDAQLFRTAEELIHAAKNSKGKLLVVDESALMLDRHDQSRGGEQSWLAKTSRHHGHSSIFIGQNLADVPKGIRTQCEQIIVMGCSRTDARNLTDEYDDDRIMRATKLPKFNFVRILTTGGVTFGYVNPDTHQIFEGRLSNEKDDVG